MRKLVAAPDFMLGSVAAITADGTLVAASATGSQLGAYVVGCGAADPRRRQPEARARPRCRDAADPRSRVPLGERPSSRATRRRHRPREGSPHPRRVAAGAHHGRARPRAGRRLKDARRAVQGGAWRPTSLSGTHSRQLSAGSLKNRQIVHVSGCGHAPTSRMRAWQAPKPVRVAGTRAATHSPVWKPRTVAPDGRGQGGAEHRSERTSRCVSEERRRQRGHRPSRATPM